MYTIVICGLKKEESPSAIEEEPIRFNNLFLKVFHDECKFGEMRIIKPEISDTKWFVKCLRCNNQGSIELRNEVILIILNTYFDGKERKIYTWLRVVNSDYNGSRCKCCCGSGWTIPESSKDMQKHINFMQSESEEKSQQLKEKKPWWQL